MHLDLCLICQKERSKESLVTKKKEGRLDEIKRQLSENHEYQTGKYTLLYDAVKDTSSEESQKFSYHYILVQRYFLEIMLDELRRL